MLRRTDALQVLREAKSIPAQSKSIGRQLRRGDPAGVLRATVLALREKIVLIRIGEKIAGLAQHFAE